MVMLIIVIVGGKEVNVGMFNYNTKNLYYVNQDNINYKNKNKNKNRKRL